MKKENQTINVDDKKRCKNKTEIGARFKTMREKCNYEQQKVAEYLGVDQSALSRFESGERGMPLSALEKGCLLFGISLQELYDKDFEIKPTIIVASKSSKMTTEDMDAVAAINQIVENMDYMLNL